MWFLHFKSLLLMERKGQFLSEDIFLGKRNQWYLKLLLKEMENSLYDILESDDWNTLLQTFVHKDI